MLVVSQLTFSNPTHKPRIPYRNSKLTRILQDALGGTSVGLLIVNLAPGVKFRQDTLNTLKYAPEACEKVTNALTPSLVLRDEQRTSRISL